MKKTIIALMALAGVAMGDTSTITPLSETTGWTDVSLRDRATWTHVNDTLTLDNSNWGQAVSTYDLVTNLGDPLTFAFDITRGNVSAGISVVFIGTEKTLVIGTKGYGDGSMFYGTTDNVSAESYYLNEAWDSGITLGSAKLLDSALNYGATASVSGSTQVNAAGNTILTLSVSSTTAASSGTATVDLGKDFILDKIMICGDGANGATGIWTVSAMSVTGSTVVPEPTTATLSLLALAGLAARRRRK